MTMAERERKVQEIFRGKDILVYGALNRAQSAVEALEAVFPGQLRGCAVTRMGNNPTDVCGMPVREIGTYEALGKEQVVVVIAATPVYYEEIAESLHRQGYPHVCTYDGRMQNLLFRIRTRRFMQERLRAEQEKEE